MTEPKKKIRSHFATGLRGRDTTFSESNAKKVVLSFARGASVSEHTLRECLVVLFPEAKANIREKAKDSKYTRLVNFLEENGTVTDLQVYAKFGMTFPQVQAPRLSIRWTLSRIRQRGRTSGMLSMTTVHLSLSP